jgi:hypothetical protein
VVLLNQLRTIPPFVYGNLMKSLDDSFDIISNALDMLFVGY